MILAPYAIKVEGKKLGILVISENDSLSDSLSHSLTHTHTHPSRTFFPLGWLSYASVMEIKFLVVSWINLFLTEKLKFIKN